MSETGATQVAERSDTTPPKKSPLDSLSRDDLLTKCKSLLAISQKAKQAKDDAVEEVKQTKHKLNMCVQESEKLKSDNERLKLRINKIADEKESVLSAIENVKSNNLELQNLVRSISSERDSFFQDVERLNTEKQKLIKVVDMIGGENDANMSENRSLKEDKRRLNDELDTNQSERDSIESEIKDIKLKLVYLLNNSFALLKSFKIDVSPADNSDVESGKKFTGVICDLISKLDTNLVLTMETVSKTSLEKNAAQTMDNICKESQTFVPEVEEKSTSTEVTTELNSEINELKTSLAELEPRLVVFETENKSLKDELNILRSQAEETSCLLIDNGKHAEELMDELEKCRILSSNKTKEIGHLQDEIGALMEKNKKQAFNAMEMKGVKNENEELKKISVERESEIDSLKNVIKEMEVNNSKFSLDIESLGNIIAGKEEEVTRFKDDKEVLEKSIAEKCVLVEKLEKEIEIIRKDAEESNVKCTLVIEELTGKLGDLTGVLEMKEKEITAINDKMVETERKYTLEIATLRSELSKLEQSVEIKENAIATMKLEREHSDDNSNKFSVEAEQRAVELTNLRQLVDEKNVELETLRGDLREAERKIEMYCTEIRSFRNEILFVQKMLNPDSKVALEEPDEPQINLDECATGIAKLKLDVTNLQTLLTDNEGEINSLKAEIKAIENEKAKHKLEVEGLLIEMCSALSEINPTLTGPESDDVESNIVQKCLSGIHSLKNEVNRLQTTVHEKGSEVLKLKQEMTENETKMSNCVSELESLKAELSSVESTAQTEELDKVKREELKSATATLQQVIASRDEELTSTRAALARSDSEVDRLTADLLKLSRVLEERNREIASTAEESRSEIRVLKNDVANLERAIDAKEREVSALNEERNEKQSDVLRLQTVLVEKEQDMLRLNEECQERRTSVKEVESLNTEIGSLREMLQVKENEIQSVLENTNKGASEVDGLNERIVELEKALASRQTELDCAESRHVDETSELRQRMERELTEQLRAADERYHCKRESMSDELVNVQNASAETEAALARVGHECDAAKRENAELLGEMNEMNQVLKQRGETISKLKELNNDLEHKLKCSVAELTTMSEEKEKTMEESNRLKSKVLQLEREMRDHGETASEAMSCSTLGRADESNRLRDVEDSFEDRYTKLRVIAVRLKKRNSELVAQLAATEAERGKMAAELQTKSAQLSSNAKNVQSIQLECDKLHDLRDSAASELRTNQKLLEATVAEATEAKAALAEVNLKVERMGSEMGAGLGARATLEAKIKELAIELQALRSSRSDGEREAKRLTEELKRTEQRLKEESTRHRQTSEQLKAKKQEAKKNNVRCLEIDDYERSVAELTEQLAAEKAKVVELNGRLDNQQELTDGLNEQIRLMEESLAAEGARSNEVVDQLNVLRLRLTETSAASTDRDSEISRLRSAVEVQREAAEVAALQLGQLASEKLRLEQAARQRSEALAQQVRELSDEVRCLSDKLSDRDAELTAVRGEFDSYKVRAQSVLRQKVRPDDAAASNVDCGEEIAQLRHSADVSMARLEETSAKLCAASAELSSLHLDRDRMLVKCRHLSEQVGNLTATNHQLLDSARDRAAEHRDAASKTRIHYDIIVQDYKTRLEVAEEAHNRDCVLLKEQIASLETKLRSCGTTDRSHAGEDSRRNWSGGAAAFLPVRRSPENVIMSEREEGEGSESVDSLSPHPGGSSSRELMPLDKLLELDESAVPRVSPRAELAAARSQVALSGHQVQHLSALLAEAEQDLARLNQLNDVLKEEIRRNQRSVEREQHAHNQEYLKNVVFKFVTLQVGDERSRLVPVLNTILKLSPEETNHLSAVARGGQEGAARGWGSYLGL